MEVVGPISGDGRHVANSCSGGYAAAGWHLLRGFRRVIVGMITGRPGDSDPEPIAVTIALSAAVPLLFDSFRTVIRRLKKPVNRR